VQRSAKKFAFNRNIEVTIITVPTWTTTGAADPVGPDLDVPLRNLLLAPCEAGAIGPDAMHDDGDRASNHNPGLLGADMFNQSNAPRFQCRPMLGPM
jgi:hypothetical protein